MYTVEINGLRITCDTLDEVRGVAKLLSEQSGKPIALIGRQRAIPKRSPGIGPQRSWAEAAELARKEGISRNEARSRLAAQKRQAALKALQESGVTRVPMETIDESVKGQLYPLRRKRGRPRKHPRPEGQEGGSAKPANGQAAPDAPSNG